MLHSKFHILHSKFGFTLIETVVALALLTAALAGPVTLATRSIFHTRFSKNKLIAAQLAAEGIEFVRQKRDTNIMRGVDWGTDLPAVGIALSYQRDIDVAVLWVSCGSCNAPLGYNRSNGLYFQGGCSPNCTPFTRVITVDRSIGPESVLLPAFLPLLPSPPGRAAGSVTIIQDNRMRITSTVTWQDNIGPQSLTLTQIIYNWR